MRVLYATDGSEAARQGERLITSIFNSEKVEIHVLSITPEPIQIPEVMDARYELDRLDVPPLDSAEVARQAADHLDDAGFIATSSSTRGIPAFEILRLLGEETFDLAVLGASHSTWLGNVLLGSVSTHVLHHSPSSVIVTHRAPAADGRVLIGIDGSAEAGHSAELAGRLLDPERSRIYVATVVTQPWVSVAAYRPGPVFGSQVAYEKAQAARMEHAWNMVDMTCAQLKKEGYETEGAVLAGSPGPQLLKEAENLSADLVVVGSRGLGTMRRTLLGSVSDQVVRHAPATLVGRFKNL